MAEQKNTAPCCVPKARFCAPHDEGRNTLEKRKVFKAAKNNTKDTYQERNALADTIINPHLHPDALTLDALREGGPPPPPQQADDDDASEGDDEEEHAIPNITTEEFERTCRPQAVHIQLKSAGLTAQAKDDGDEDEDAPRGEIVDFFRSFDMAEVDKSAAFVCIPHTLTTKHGPDLRAYIQYNIEITNDVRAKLEVFLKEMHDHLEHRVPSKSWVSLKVLKDQTKKRKKKNYPTSTSHTSSAAYSGSSQSPSVKSATSQHSARYEVELFSPQCPISLCCFNQTQNALKCHLCARMPTVIVTRSLRGRISISTSGRLYFSFFIYHAYLSPSSERYIAHGTTSSLICSRTIPMSSHAPRAVSRPHPRRKCEHTAFLRIARSKNTTRPFSLTRRGDAN